MDLGTYRNGFDCRMLSMVKSERGGSSTSSSSVIPPLPQCLPLENITLENQKYRRSVELKKVLGVPHGNTLEDHRFGVGHSKPTPPLATEKLKKFRDSVQDTSNKARDRANSLRRSIFMLDRYEEDLTSTKRQRIDILFNESLGQANTLKMGGQVICNPHARPPEKLEAKTKSNDLEMNKRLRTSMLDARADGRSADVPRQPIIVEKDRDMVRTVGGNAIHIEEKIPRLPAGGVGWDKKMKRKRSFGAAGNRAISGESGDRDFKQAIHAKLSAEPKLQPIEAQGCRSRASPGMVPLVESLLPTNSGFGTASRIDLEGVPPLRERTAITEERIERIAAKGNNKTNIHETHAGSPCSTIKGKLSRTPRTCSVAMLDSSPDVHYSSGADGGGQQQATSTTKSMSLSVADNNERPMYTTSSASNMAHWVGQRPLQILRTKRSDLVSPLSENDEAQISSKGFATSDLHARTSFGTGGSLLVSSVDIYNPKFKMELENFPSPPALSGGEESGGGKNKPKEERSGIAEAAVIANYKAGASTLPTKKNKVLARVKNGDSLGGRRTIGRILSSTKLSIAPSVEQIENLPAKNPLQSVRRGLVTNRRSCRPPSKKPMVCKTSIHFGNTLNSGSPDHAGELDDDHEELLVAATSARDASYRACSNLFWKKMECYFASVTSQDESCLKHQLNFIEELSGCLYQMPRDEKNALVFRGGDLMLKQDSICSGGETKSHANQESVETGGGFGMSKTFDKAPLYQRILSALIEEDESEELNPQKEGRNNFQCASDDSHCGSCNYNDFEPKDRDRMESEVESEVFTRTQKHGLVDRISCDKSVSPNTDSNRSVSSSVCNNEPWQADDGLSYSNAELVPLIRQSDLGFPHSLKVNASPISSSKNQYQMLSLDDRLLLELQCIGLCPTTMPHLAEAEEAIDQDITKLQAGLFQQAQKMKKTLGKIHEVIPCVKDAERRNMEQVAMSKLIEMAYKRRMVSHGSHSSKRVVRRVSNQVALAFAERTLSRCRKFEDMGKSCFSEAPLQDIIFSASLCSSDLNSVDCVGSRTARNRYKRSCNRTSDLSGSGSSSKQQYVSNSHEPVLNKRKKREVLLNDVGSASSRAEDRNIEMLTNHSVSGNVNPSLDTFTSVRKSKAKSKQKRSYVLASGDELQSSFTEAAHPASTSACASSLSRTIVANILNRKSELSKEEKEKEKEKDLADFPTEQQIELGSFENEDYGSLLDFDEDSLQDQDLLGLEIPMDNLSDVHMFI